MYFELLRFQIIGQLYRSLLSAVNELAVLDEKEGIAEFKGYIWIFICMRPNGRKCSSKGINFHALDG